MKEDAETKARRRRQSREALPAPLNQIALRHVDAVQALGENQRSILAGVLAQVGIAHLPRCLAVIKSSEKSIPSGTDLIASLNLPERPPPTDKTINVPADAGIDIDYLTCLLTKCYPDMPEVSASALAASEVMDQAVRVVAATRLALGDAKSDFVITVLYTLFENRLQAIEKMIAGNPSFIKAMQLSRPHWKPKPLS